MGSPGKVPLDPREAATEEAMKGPFKVYRKTALTPAREMTEDFLVHTTEGDMGGNAGDFLCIDAKGNPYPCAREVFEKTYVEEPAPQLDAVEITSAS